MKAQIFDYSERAIALSIEASDLEKRINEAKGMFVPNLKYGEGQRPGWIFSKKRSETAQKLAAEIGHEIRDYSDRAVAMFGDLEPHTKALIEARGMYNARLKDADGNPFAGWVFSKKQTERVQQICAAL